jgi:hypothetical protein
MWEQLVAPKAWLIPAGQQAVVFFKSFIQQHGQVAEFM